MRVFLFVFTFAILTTTAISEAFAQTPASDVREGVFFCGSPADNSTMTTTGDQQPFCDLYPRRFEYRERRNELRDLIDERRSNYGALGAEARANYKKQLEELHNSISSDSKY